MNDISHALGASLGGLFLLGVTISGFMMLFGMPFLAYLGVRRLGTISRELERLNETLSAKITITKSGPLGL